MNKQSLRFSPFTSLKPSWAWNVQKTVHMTAPSSSSTMQYIIVLTTIFPFTLTVLSSSLEF